jgi:NhaC family Na+:H+ antiporter
MFTSVPLNSFTIFPVLFPRWFMNEVRKSPTLFQAFIPIFCLILLLTLNVIIYGEDTLSGANQIALLLAAAIAGVIAIRLKLTWSAILSRIVSSIGSAMPSILILLLIGSLAGTWMISGVVPAMIYYGLKIIHPSIFPFATVVACGIVSLATGSSWSTIATVGIALIGIGQALGFPVGLIAGAIISGAYFGDKMSPLSDTTNLAPAMAGTDLFTHIRYMMITTVPSMSLTLIIFLVIGFAANFENSGANVQAVLEQIHRHFFISPVLLIVPVLLILVIVKKMPPLPAILFGTLLGGLFAVIFQPEIIRNLPEGSHGYLMSSYISVMQAMFGDISITTENLMVNELLTSTGMAGMLDTIWLILAAMTFGGVMESAGMLMRISEAIIRWSHSTGSLVASTVATSIFFNITASDQYISIVVPGRMYAKTYRERGYKPELLSRTLEDGGTVTSVLVPWNTGGATQARVLGVSTLTYLPYCFFNIISPFMSILIASFNYKIRRLNGRGEQELSAERDDS